MKIVFIYRKQRPDAFSIEELFRAIARELRKGDEVINYEVGERANLFSDIRNLRDLDADIYHVTGDVNYFVNFLPKGRTVLTVHDLGHYLFGLKRIKRLIYKWLWLILPIRSAAIVTCVSEETKGNISRYLGISSTRLVFIPNCVSPLFKHVTKVFNLTKPTILQVGTKPYKNVPRLVRALKGIPCRLVLIGKIDDALELELVKCETDYVNRVNLTHEQLVSEYVACDLVAFASTGEGFGVPIIEAQAVGRALLTSDVSPMREIAGAGACLVNPLSEQAMREGICRLIKDENYRTNMVALGLENAQSFSAAAIARSYLDIYTHLIAPSVAKRSTRGLGSLK